MDWNLESDEGSGLGHGRVGVGDASVAEKYDAAGSRWRFAREQSPREEHH